MIKIPVYKPFFNGKEKIYVNDCIDSTWISSKGKYISMFEQFFADYIGTKYAVSVSNGTTAIHLALLTLGIGAGDEVIVPSLTYIASVNPILYVGATPVFVDVNENTWQLNCNEVRKKITSKTKAIIAVHLYGHPCEIEELSMIAKENHLFLIEDCAEAIGTEYTGKKVGGFGDIGCFSFFGNKTITTGEGGMIVTNDKTIMTRATNLKGQGLAMYREYWHDIVGYNFRMTNICAAIGVAQLESISDVIGRKRQIAAWYKNYLKTNLVYLFEGDDGKNGIFNTYWMCTLVLKDNIESREQLRKYLLNQGIETRPTFYPVHTMPMYSQKYQKLPISEQIGWSGVNLPSYPDLSEEEVMFVCDCINHFFDMKRE